MSIKVETINRWTVRLDGDDTSIPSLTVNSLDGDEKSMKIIFGGVERIVTIEDWVALVNAVGTKIKYTATR